METEKITLEEPLVIGDVTVIPVAALRRSHRQGARGIFGFASKRPTHVIVLTPSAKMAWRSTGEPVTMVQLAEELPALKERLPGILD